MKDGGRGVKNILSLFHMVVDNMLQHIQSVPNIYWVQRQACIKYHSFWHTDLPAIQQPFYRPLRIGAARSSVNLSANSKMVLAGN